MMQVVNAMHSPDNDAFGNTHMCLKMLMEPDDEVLELRRQLVAMQSSEQRMQDTQVAPTHQHTLPHYTTHTLSLHKSLDRRHHMSALPFGE